MGLASWACSILCPFLGQQEMSRGSFQTLCQMDLQLCGNLPPISHSPGVAAFLLEGHSCLPRPEVPQGVFEASDPWDSDEIQHIGKDVPKTVEQYQ